MPHAICHSTINLYHMPYALCHTPSTLVDLAYAMRHCTTRPIRYGIWTVLHDQGRMAHGVLEWQWRCISELDYCVSGR